MNRIYILPGQFGIIGSLGSYLAYELRAFGDVFVDPSWQGLQTLQRLRIIDCKDRVALIGYSLGANETAWLASKVSAKMLIDLIVAYDPSRQSPLAAGGVQYVPSNVKRAVCYYNPDTWYYGGARFVGDMVENQRIDMMHLAVCNSYELHNRTIDAVRSTFTVPAA